MPGKKAGVLTIVGFLCVVVALLIFSQYRQCAAAEGATLGDSNVMSRLSALEADNRTLQREIETLKADLATTTTDLGHCRGRTNDLRDVLRALIPAWPGRARLPTPNGEWDPWPVAGSNREDYASLPRGK